MAAFDARALVIERFWNEVETFRASQGRSTVYRQLKRATELTAQEYGDRFLVELIQNAHDVLGSATRDGRIRVLLDMAEGDFGVLYVANTGEPFTAERFSAICEFAQSSKRPGESIGNKGIGFRSVLQISEWPEIYSRRPDGGSSPDSFDGFCFRFARPEDLERYVGDLAPAIQQNISPYSLPVPIDDQPEIVGTLAEDGFATVVRLPLKTGQAAIAASSALDWCIGSDAPVPLFLERLETLELERRDRGGQIRHVRLIRSEEDLQLKLKVPIRCSRVTLRYEENGLIRPADFLVGSVSIAEASMLDAIWQSRAQGKLPEVWESWTGDGRVSVGMAADSSTPPRLYNYLPMGPTAASPFFGFLDAPFFTKLDRTTLDETIRLNDVLLDHSARVCLGFAEALAGSGAPCYAPVVARLLAWDEKHRRRLLTASAENRPIDGRRLTPVSGSGEARQVYARIDEVFQWSPPRPTLVFTVDRLRTRVGVPFLDARLEDPVCERLAALRAEVAGTDFKPSPKQLAEWAERLAIEMANAQAPISDWDAFYADLMVVFPSWNVGLLRGRRLILSEQNTVLRAGPDASSEDGTDPVVFLAPVRERVEGEEEVAEGVDIDIPNALRPFVRYTHPSLRWRNPATDVSIRSFFVQNRLVRRFGRRELRELIRSLLSVEQDVGVYAAALEFAYRLAVASPDSTDPKLSDMNLRVPVEGDRWVPATDAIFSPTWRRPGAKALEDLERVVGDRSPELAAYVADRLIPPDVWPFRLGDRDTFAEFLTQVGVKDGLWPRRRSIETTQRYGYGWSANSLSREAGLTSAVAAAWDAAVSSSQAAFAYPNHVYALEEGVVWSLPGQDSYEDWPTMARERFAALVAIGLTEWPDEMFECTFAKVSGHSDYVRWPSPVAAFLAGIPWVPVAGANSIVDPTLRLVRESWFATDEDGRLPDFMPHVSTAVQHAAFKSSRAKARFRKLRARFWDDPSDAPAALAMLGQLFAMGAVSDDAHGAFAAIYQQKWREVISTIEDGADEELQLALQAPIIVRRSERLEVWQARTGNDLVVLVDEINPVRIRLIEETRTALLFFNAVDTQPKAAFAKLQRALGPRARLASHVEFAIEADGDAFHPSEVLPYLRESELGALAELTNLFVALRAPVPSYQARNVALERLQRARVMTVNELRVTVAGLDRLAAAQPELLAYPHDQYPTLIVSRALMAARPLSPAFAHPICEIAGIPGAGPMLELALRRAHEWLGNRPVPVDEHSLLPVDLATEALEVTPGRIAEARALVEGSLSACVRVLLPVVAYALEGDWSDVWFEVIDDCRTLDQLRAALVPIATRLPVPLDELLTTCRSAGGPADVRDRLMLDYGRFNAALRRVGHGYEPQVDLASHQSAFDAFQARRHVWIDDELRSRFWTAFATNSSLDRYVRGRAREGLHPDPSWLEAFRIPPDDVMHSQVAAWLETWGPVPEGRPDLVALTTVRQSNRAFLDELQARIRDLIIAWCSKHNEKVPVCWAGSSEGTLRLAEAAFDEGWGDFAVLDEGHVMRWLRTTGRWPANMPESVVPEELGLTAGDLERPKIVVDEEREQRELARRSLVVDGTPVVVDRTDFRALADAVAGTMDGPALETPERLTALEPADTRVTRGGSSGGRGVTTRATFMSEEQRSGIGFVGELVVREWLRRKYPDLDIDACWKSGYKNVFLGRSDGDDSLGYDFEVITRSRRRLYEVKASLGDDWQFSLGESEVREAHAASAERRVIYRIVYVASALDTTHRQILVLPNPFSARGANRLRVVGSGMRFKFEPIDH